MCTSHTCVRGLAEYGKGVEVTLGSVHMWGGSGPAPTGRRAASHTPPPPATQRGMTPLHHAAQWGHKDVAALLLERGADKEAKDNVSVPMHVGPAAALPTQVWMRGHTCEHFHTFTPHFHPFLPRTLKGPPRARGGPSPPQVWTCPPPSHSNDV